MIIIIIIEVRHEQGKKILGEEIFKLVLRAYLNNSRMFEKKFGPIFFFGACSCLTFLQYCYYYYYFRTGPIYLVWRTWHC